MGQPPITEFDAFTDMISAVRRRLFQAVLYELQTGGGMCAAELATRVTDSDGVASQMEAIRATLSKLRQLSLSAPSRIAARLSRPNIHLLDIGAGKAPWSLAIASRDPSIFVTAVDLPDQMAALQHSVSAAGLSQQFRSVSVDVFSPAWPPTKECHLVVIANVCHLFDEQRNRKLLHRATQCLRPGGTLAIIDQVLDEDPNWACWGALYVLGALHGAPGGRLFPVRKYEAWLNDIGSWQVATHPICPLPPLTLITALRT